MLPFHHLLRPAIFNVIHDIFEPKKGSFPYLSHPSPLIRSASRKPTLFSLPLSRSLDLRAYNIIAPTSMLFNFHSFNDSHMWLINHLAQSGFFTGTCFSLTFLYPDFDDLEFTSHYETLTRSPSSKSILLLVSSLRIFSPTLYPLLSYSRFFLF